jgi:hypothetical protein
LAILVERVQVNGYAGIEDRVQLVAVGAIEKHRHHLLDLLW